MYCLQCGNQIPEGSKFCFKCGASLGGLAAVPPRQTASGPEHRAAHDDGPQPSLAAVSVSTSAEIGLTPDQGTPAPSATPEEHRPGVGPQVDRVGSQSDTDFSTVADAGKARMAKHVKVLAYSSLVVGVLFLIASVLEILPKSQTPGFYAPSGMLAANPAMAIMTIFFFVVPCACVFVGLKFLKPWGRTISIGLAILTMVIPLSWYAFWVLNHEGTKSLFGLAGTGPAASRNPLTAVGKGVFIVFAVLVNIGLISAIVKDITGPSSTRTVPIGDVASGIGSDTGYCGMDEFGKLTGGPPVSIGGTVKTINSSGSTRTYVLEDTTSSITVIVNRQFPPPTVGEKIRVMGIVQCPPIGALVGKLMHEVTRMQERSAR
jgi:hypothetical protein